MNKQLYETELKALTDRQLREKCLYYGLQNVPITKDTRQIIINKLMERIQKEKEKKNAIRLRQSKSSTSSSYKSLRGLNKNVEKFSMTNRRMNSAKILGADALQQLRVQINKNQNQKRWTPKKSIFDIIEHGFAEDTKSEPCSSPQSLSAESICYDSKKSNRPVSANAAASALVLYEENQQTEDGSFQSDIFYDVDNEERESKEESGLRYVSKNRRLL